MTTPLTIDKFETGLVQAQPNQILKNDAFPVLFNAFVFRNKVIRKFQWQLVGRLRRKFVEESIGNSSASPWSFNIYTLLGITGEPNKALEVGSISLDIGGVIFTDQSNGTLTSATPGNSGTVDYSSGDFVITHTLGAGSASKMSFNYFPALPAMGIFDRNTFTNSIDNVFFDTKYAYKYSVSNGFEELEPGITWSMQDYNLPYPTNYWQDLNNFPIFWTTSNTGETGDPIRYTNAEIGSSWYDFTPIVTPDPAPANAVRMYQCKFLIPFRGRLFAFNTYEGITSGGLAGATQKRNRIRCCGVGNPFTEVSAIITTVVPNTWDDTVTGLGYFEDLPTTEEIIGVSATNIQLIIQTNTKTWVLSYVGINSTPFRVDLIDESLGSESGFASVNMGGYINSIGNRSVTSSTPNKVQSIDEKVLTVVQNINRNNQGFSRVYALRDYVSRTNSYIYPYQPDGEQTVRFPNRRLLQNYDNGSWAIYYDSLTCLGSFRNRQGIAWQDANFAWQDADFPWNSGSTNQPVNAAGNQQGFIGIIDSTQNVGASLFLTDIVPDTGKACTFVSPAHNLENGMVVQITGIAGDMASLNGTIGQVQTITVDQFYLFTFSIAANRFLNPVIAPSGTYIGGGLVSVRQNFSIVTKAFNYLKDGQSIHVSYLDALVNVNDGVTVDLNVYASLNNANPVNFTPENTTSNSVFGQKLSLENPTTYPLEQVNNRALINQRANMITFEFTLSDASMASDAYSTEFELSSMTIWNKKAGRPLMPLGGG